MTIQPKDIDVRDCLSETFGQIEHEELATAIISFQQAKGTWVPFTRKEIRDFLENDEFYLDEAEQREFVVFDDKTCKYSVTEAFIRIVHDAHPA